MKPYRVKVSNGKTVRVLSSMKSPDKKTGICWAYVLEKHEPKSSSGQGMLPVDEFYENVAHRITNRWNSTILESYVIEQEEQGSQYELLRHVFGSREDRITKFVGKKRTQEDCLRLAMNDYCSRNNLEIIGEL